MKKSLVPFCLTLIIFIGSAGVSWGADSQKVGPFDKYHENGKLALKATWKDGKWEGPFERYYENGKLESKEPTRMVSMSVLGSFTGKTES